MWDAHYLYFHLLFRVVSRQKTQQGSLLGSGWNVGSSLTCFCTLATQPTPRFHGTSAAPTNQPPNHQLALFLQPPLLSIQPDMWNYFENQQLDPQKLFFFFRKKKRKIEGEITILYQTGCDHLHILTNHLLFSSFPLQRFFKPEDDVSRKDENGIVKQGKNTENQ